MATAMEILPHGGEERLPFIIKTMSADALATKGAGYQQP